MKKRIETFNNENVEYVKETILRDIAVNIEDMGLMAHIETKSVANTSNGDPMAIYFDLKVSLYSPGVEK